MPEVLPGALYIVATPIGNLSDISDRARTTLAAVDLIAAEDTRHSARLLHHFSIKTPIISLHDFNEAERSRMLIGKLSGGESIALISDAGTPLISDPGYLLVKQARHAGVTIVPVPGPCAAMTALSAAGLATDRFVFEGFPPSKSGARLTCFRKLNTETRTIIFYESSHRILSSLTDMLAIFGDREAVIAREMTKRFETIRSDCLSGLIQWIEQDEKQKLGEFVVILAGADLQMLQATEIKRAEHLLYKFLVEISPGLSLSQAVSLVVDLTELKKNQVYGMALKIDQEIDQDIDRSE
ncbi:MAG: 16S rRNA (cytidine(1402)-2'-O)-methyltransferase [Acidiferrobacterales bacterium]